MEQGISLEELQLAARNHGMPLEALRWDVTPVGLHYLLTHYDIPDVDAESWRLDVDGLVDRAVSLSLDELRARPSVETAVTMECAGNGRVHVEPHVVSQPWLLEAVGTAQWRGIPVAGLLEEAGIQGGAVEALFTGLDNADGKRVRKLSMTPCRQESCPIYNPGRRYRFALELRASDARPAAKLGPLSELRRLSLVAG